jgi:hypothetical protein
MLSKQLIRKLDVGSPRSNHSKRNKRNKRNKDHPLQEHDATVDAIPTANETTEFVHPVTPTEDCSRGELDGDHVGHKSGTPTRDCNFVAGDEVVCCIQSMLPFSVVIRNKNRKDVEVSRNLVFVIFLYQKHATPIRSQRRWR